VSDRPDVIRAIIYPDPLKELYFRADGAVCLAFLAVAVISGD